MDDTQKAKDYINRCIHFYSNHLAKAIDMDDRKGMKTLKDQLIRYHRLKTAIESSCELLDELIYKATYRNRVSTSSIGPCWERFLLECYEEE